MWQYPCSFSPACARRTVLTQLSESRPTARERATSSVADAACIESPRAPRRGDYLGGRMDEGSTSLEPCAGGTAHGGGAARAVVSGALDPMGGYGGRGGGLRCTARRRKRHGEGGNWLRELRPRLDAWGACASSGGSRAGSMKLLGDGERIAVARGTTHDASAAHTPGGVHLELAVHGVREARWDYTGDGRIGRAHEWGGARDVGRRQNNPSLSDAWEEDQRRKKEGERNTERKEKKKGAGKERTKIPRMAIT
ncbi:hypothetical protein B0H13DRAFT_2459807 [Mycena leptocephala]|nr:hypothetical protein B0H13DRAFT_2459807 [Mycena leptocephala]